MTTYLIIKEFAGDYKLSLTEQIQLLCKFIDQKDKVWPELREYIVNVVESELVKAGEEELSSK